MRRAFVKNRNYIRPNRGQFQRVANLRAAALTLNRRPVPARRAFASAVRSVSEKKGVDTDISLTPVIATTSTNASSFVLNLIQAGNGSWNRVGRKVHSKSLRIKGLVSISNTPTFATGAGVGNFLRMVVVWDKQPSSGAIPTFDAIFGITAQDGTESCPDITCPPRYDNMDRFQVLLDRCYKSEDLAVPAFGSAPTMTQYMPIDEYVKLGARETVFSGQSAPMTIADISTGALYVFFRAAGNVAASVAAVDGIARLRYTDV